MDTPSLVVLPPTPLHPSNISQPHSTISTPTPSTPSDLPDLSPSGLDRERSSTETTIVTIYSMYEDDERSWSASASDSAAGHSQSQHHHHKHRPSTKEMDVAIAGVQAYRESYLQANGTALSDDSAYYDATFDLRRSSSPAMRFSLKDKSRTSVLSSDSVHLAYAESRPSSSNGIPRPVSMSQDRHDQPAQSEHFPRHSDHTPTDRTGKSHSRPTSRHRKSHSSNVSYNSNGTVNGASTARNIEESLPSIPASPSVVSTSTASPPPRQEFSPSPSRPPISSPPLSSAHSSLQVFLTPPSSPRVRSVSSGAPSSKLSITPSEGEDPDAFHVRSTYAQLEVCGVRGDGIDEGVERTRARVGGNRASELRAERALADEHEKTRDLTQQELELLSSLDRYGFFVTPSHDRLILLPSAPLHKTLSRQSEAQSDAPPSAPLLTKQPSSPPVAKEKTRIAKWGRMLEARSRDVGGNVEEWSIRPPKEVKLRERVYKGIPDRWRRAAWEVLMNRFSRMGKTDMHKLIEEYREALDQPSTYDVQIDLDVPRTIGGHVMFRTRYGQGQRSLFHVLHCLSLRCEACGYCQGMGPIAATLLCYFDPERTYVSLVQLHDSYKMHSIFSPGFPGLLEAIYVQERVTEQMLPAVYTAFKKHIISTTSYATKWYITLFANTVPFQMQLRLWDAFLLEGQDIFVVVAVAIVWVYRDHITSNQANFETVLSLLSSFFVPEDEDAVMAWIEKVLADKKLRSSMQQWRKEWNRLVAAGEHTQTLL